MSGANDPLLALLPAWVRPLMGDAPVDVVALEQGLVPRDVRAARRKARALLQRLEAIAYAQGTTPEGLVRRHAAVAALTPEQRRARPRASES